METTKHLTSQAGIQIWPHHLHIPGSPKVGTQSLTIREQVMSKYAVFVQHWNIAISQAATEPGASFAQLWINNPTFRGEMTQGLQAVGVANPDEVLPSHLQELVLLCNVEGDPDIRPLIFRLHSDAPDPKKLMGQVMKDGDNSNLAPLTPPSIWQRLFSKTPKPLTDSL
jgi:hypothetical protein